MAPLLKAANPMRRTWSKSRAAPLATIRSRLARARAQIKAYLDGERPALRRVK